MSEDEDEEGEISSLKQTLHAQQKLVHQLYLELEAEREASSTAANEALSMILRLQREKAAEKLEAIQFKRMTQQDLNHAHQIILLFQETLRHKDMFIASLHFQLQAYRHQMLAMGLTDSQIRDLESPHPLFPEDLHATHSTPPDQEEFEFYGKDRNTIFDFEHPAPASYWEKIEHLDARVSELSFDPPQTAFAFPQPDNIAHLNAIELDLPCSSTYQPNDDPENLLQIPCSETQNTPPSSSQSTTIHDVFEVPQNAPVQKYQGKTPGFQDDNRLRKPDPIPHHGSGVGWSMKSSSAKIKRNKSGEKVSMNCHLALMDLANGIFPFENDLHRLKRRLEKLEGERGGKHGAFGNDEEDQVSLLRDIHEKLSTIQSEMRSGRAKHPVVDESSLISLMENLFFYSL